METLTSVLNHKDGILTGATTVVFKSFFFFSVYSGK